MEIHNVKSMIATLLSQTDYINESIRRGSMSKVQLSEDVLPTNRDTAKGLLYLDCFSKHMATLVRYRLRYIWAELSEQEAEALASELDKAWSGFTDATFTLLYPTSAKYKTGRSRLWWNRPWLSEGVKTEQAMKECSLMAAKYLVGVTYRNISTIEAMAIKPALDAMLTGLSYCFASSEMPTDMSKLSIAVEPDQRWTSKIYPDGVAAPKRFPDVPSVFSPQLRAYIVNAFPDGEQYAREGKLVETGDVFRYGNSIQVVKQSFNVTLKDPLPAGKVFML